MKNKTKLRLPQNFRCEPSVLWGSRFRFLAFVFLMCALPVFLGAQGIRENTPLQNEGSLPLKRVVVLTSGLAYYEHSGQINGAVNIPLMFRLDAVNDALKSLVINDSASRNPSVTYQSLQTLTQTLQSFQINLSDNPSLDFILTRLRGAEVEISFDSIFRFDIDISPEPVTGRIIGIDYRVFQFSENRTDAWVMLNTEKGVRSFNLNAIESIRFTDPSIENDINRALDLIAASRILTSRLLTVNLPGTGRRDVSISYVIPSPVWKVSYRLDLGASGARSDSGAPRALFQGWAIVDNDSDSDWENIELSLVAGRPSSFIQNLFAPYYVSRPVLPLSIAGTAEAAVHDQGYAAPRLRAESVIAEDSAEVLYEMPDRALAAPTAMRQSAVTGGAVETAAGSSAGGQFEFTIRNPVSLDRKMSAMLPLVETQIQAQSVLIYSGRGRHPRLGAEITNTSGMKLPAGPVTVFEGGVYAGDALLEFWNENEKRLISFGEDLSVTVNDAVSNTRTVSSVVVSSGVMTINRSQNFSKTYTITNNGSAQRLLVLEHSKTADNLVSPAAAEQTASSYRFNVNLPANRETVFTVNEQRPISERITLMSLSRNNFLSYTTNNEIPQNIRQALIRADELRQVVINTEEEIKNLEAQHARLVSDQDRIRRNLEAAGSQTQQGQNFLQRLIALDSEIDEIAPKLETARANLARAQAAFSEYLSNLSF